MKDEAVFVVTSSCTGCGLCTTLKPDKFTKLESTGTAHCYANPDDPVELE